ncbi:MAG: efflux RND transporter periplasmic adaptor subunit [Anaerolineae bacterium]|jgi:HlyD family secretion protein
MNRRTSLILGIIGAAAAVAGVLVWRLQQQSALSTEILRSAVVKNGNMLIAVSASGSIEPEERADLAFQISGRVATVPVEVGDQVQAGDLLACLDTQRLILEIDQAEASLAAAEAQLASIEAGARREEIEAADANLRAAEAQVHAAVAERDQLEDGAGKGQIASAEAEVASALTEQKKSEDWHDTTMECKTIRKSAGDVIALPGGRVITLTEGFERTICPLLGVPEEQARYRLEAADEALAAAQARLEEAEGDADQDQLRAAEANIGAAVANRDAAQAQLDLLLEGATDQQIAGAEARVVQAETSVEQAQLALEHASLEAPFDGVVAAVDIAAGELASAGVPVVVLVDLSRYHVTVTVDEMEVASLAIGQPVRVTLDALPGAVLSGKVGHIASGATPDEGVVTYDVRIDLAPNDLPVRSDTTANATILVEELKDVLLIPTWVVRVEADTGQTYVHRRVEGEIRRTDVKLGARSEGVAQVLDGLSEGDEVVRVQESSTFNFGPPHGR